MRVLVVSDTHIKRGAARAIPGAVWREAARADMILHAGDIVIGEVLDELRAHAPVHAVLGNNDLELAGLLPEQLELDLGGLRVGMVHDSGPRDGRAARLRRMFPDADLVVFGHSHIPWNQPGQDEQWLLNPGSPTERRRQPDHTAAVFEVREGRLVRPRLLVV